MIPIWTLILATIARARELGATKRETTKCIRAVLRDHGRRTGRLRDRGQPGPPCTLVPCAGLRIVVLGKPGGPFSYHMRRVA